MRKKLLQWLFFGVIFSLLPFVFTAVQFYGTPKHPQFAWWVLWPRGELFLVSVGFAADGAGEALSIEGRFQHLKIVLVGLCFLVVALSAFGYAQLQSSAYSYPPIFVTSSSVAFFVLTFTCAGLCKALRELKP
ncbi:MAG TPA: hypothetical protein VGI81_20360 [Tepidisphaeraceae bacterium]|jgi:hypothetical protein